MNHGGIAPRTVCDGAALAALSAAAVLLFPGQVL